MSEDIDLTCPAVCGSIRMASSESAVHVGSETRTLGGTEYPVPGDVIAAEVIIPVLQSAV